jgi:integrase/recombinase XerD
MSTLRVEGLSGPLGDIAVGFEEDLARQGYSETGRYEQLRLLRALSGWLEEHDLGIDAVGGERVGAFLKARRELGSKLHTTRSLAPLVEYLNAVGLLETSERPAMGAYEAFVEQYRRYLRVERGLNEGTAAGYVRVAREFLDDCASGSELALEGVTASTVTGFVTRRCARLGLSASRHCVSALRCLLRYLAIEGLVATDLDCSVLSVAGGGQPLPRGIDQVVVAKMLASCDRRRAIGRRDYAILMILARLGLRGGEVVGLGLADIDWRAGEITVRGKGGRVDRLPLPVDVGEALAGYLRRGRPSSLSRSVFLRHRAPFRGFSGTGALRGILAHACLRAAVPYASPHRLRHSAATGMLRRGASLSEIGQVLRHNHPRATAVYSAVDHDALRALAPTWPGGGR